MREGVSEYEGDDYLYKSFQDWQSVADYVDCAAIMGEKESALCQYVETIRVFVARWGLDRLPFNGGYKAVHDWFHWWLIDASHPPASFGRHAYTTMIAMDPPSGTVMTDRGRAIEVTVALNGTWKWTSESPADAKERLYADAKRQIGEEVDRLARRMEADDWTFPQDREQLDKHLAWLYRRLAYRESVRDIADREKKASERYIRKITDKDSRTLGISLPGAEPNYTP